jgi:enoyl-CoA hydratase
MGGAVVVVVVVGAFWATNCPVVGATTGCECGATTLCAGMTGSGAAVTARVTAPTPSQLTTDATAVATPQASGANSGARRMISSIAHSGGLVPVRAVTSQYPAPLPPTFRHDVSKTPGILRRTRRGQILVVSMERGAKRNAVDRALADELDDALNELDDDPSLWAGILTGTSDVFSAGSDLTARGDYVTDRGGEYGVIRRERRKPLIAAVEGPAVGGGLEIVLACDLVVASRTARFGLPEVRIGVIPTCAGLFRGPRAIPVNVAREMILTGRPIDAARGYEVGLVNVIAEPGGALDAAMALAQEICANSPVAVQASLAAVNAVLSKDDAAGWETTDRALSSVAASADAREGVAAFLEKRPPRWVGR